MRFVILASALTLAMASTAAFAQSTPAASASASAARYSTSTTEIGVLLDDPAAKTILFKHLPDMAKSDQIDMVRNSTLKDVQQYAPDQMSDKVLADIDVDLAKLPPKK